MSFEITKNSLDMPWVMSPFFWTLLNESSEMSLHEKSLCMRFVTEGYITIDLKLPDQRLTDIIDDTRQLSQSDSVVQHNRFHYSDGPRIFEGWKSSLNIASLACNPVIINMLKLFYNKAPIPFQTINFLKGTNQPMHSDTIHFNTIPKGWMAGVWVALEDMDIENGTLQVCPTSHRSPEYDLSTLRLDINNIDGKFNNYSIYEDFIEQVIQNQRYQKVPITCTKGTAVIWSNNLLHGGLRIKDENRTRYSQAIHYFFPDCDHYYCPLFSEPYKGIYAEKNLRNKNILDHG